MNDGDIRDLTDEQLDILFYAAAGSSRAVELAILCALAHRYAYEIVEEVDDD